MTAALHLIPDAPITSAGFDRLDRMSFVRSFSQAIRAAKGTDSVVLALAGPWGSGKSSLINLICSELAGDSETQQPLVMKFNPWWFTGTGQLVSAFLQQLAAAVSRPEVKEKLGSATEALDRLADAIAKPGERIEGEDAANRDIEVMKQRVNEVFLQSDRRILIFMDDIDRLTPEEMTQLLLIVRAVADFPNTTYVLSFDYEVLVEAVGSKLGIDGRTYLEKVVQLQIDVPMPGRMSLERMVIGQLETIDPNAKRLDVETQKYFRLLFESVKHFLATPRACTRLLNVLRFTYPTLAGQVYFPDMLGISCLMSFSSQSIQAIRSNSEAFVGHCDPSGKGWLSMREFHHTWLAQIPPKDRPAVESMLRLMFPKVAWALNGPLRGEEYVPVWQQQQRICSEKHFQSYFRLGLSSSEAADHQWQNVVELLDDATSFARAMQRFGPLEEGEGAEWVDELLQKASQFVHDQATSDQAASMFRAIMRRGDQIAGVKNAERGGLFSIDPVHAIVSVLLECLLKIDRPDRRLDVLAHSVREDAALLTAAELLELLGFRVDVITTDRETENVKANARLLEVLKLLDGRIQQASEGKELGEHAQYLKIIQKWYQFGRRARSREWVQEHCQEDQRFVEAVLQVWSGDSSDELLDSVDATTLLPLDFLVALFDRDKLLKRAKNISSEKPEWLTSDGRQAMLAIERLLSADN